MLVELSLGICSSVLLPGSHFNISKHHKCCHSCNNSSCFSATAQILVIVHARACLPGSVYCCCSCFSASSSFFFIISLLQLLLCCCSTCFWLLLGFALWLVSRMTNEFLLYAGHASRYLSARSYLLGIFKCCPPQPPPKPRPRPTAYDKCFCSG